MKKGLVFFLLVLTGAAGFCDSPISAETKGCLFCHQKLTPGIVGDWEASRHSRTTPAQALEKPDTARRISIDASSDKIETEYVVGCMECHGINPDAHPDSFSHMGSIIHTVVSPADCSKCHSEEAAQYSGSKKAHAIDNLTMNPLYSLLVDEALSSRSFEAGHLSASPPSPETEGATCFACHGTEIGVGPVIEVPTILGTAEVPRLTNWPNQGVGRRNPDGSLGSCTACHPRHSFSLKVARSPETCGQCHLEPDVPAYNVFKESKHGNIYDTLKGDFDMDAVPWVPGRDFTAPTCAACHISLLVDNDGAVISERSHDFGSRLWVRVFGLIASHPQPVDGRTYIIRNEDGQPLPTTFAGEPATSFLIDKDEQENRVSAMTGVCTACHTRNWIQGYLEQFASNIESADRMVLTSTELMDHAWAKGLADPSNPFDENLEHKWVSQWLIYANSIRYAAAMSGPDYATFKNGWWQLNGNLRSMYETVEKE